MRDNWDLALHSNRLVLLPYRKSNVVQYHAWMQSPSLLEATASEPLSLQEEYAMQQTWRDDPTKCTFIVHTVLDDGSLCMIGDTNFFFNDAEDPLCVEIEIMIADSNYHRLGFATTAVQMMMAYGHQKLGIQRFVAKIGYENTASLAMFTSKNLGYTVFEKHDWCEENHCALDLRAEVGAASETMKQWSMLTTVKHSPPPLDEEYNVPHGVWGERWFYTTVQQWLGAANSNSTNNNTTLALGLTNRALYGLHSLRPQTIDKAHQLWGPLVRTLVHPTGIQQAADPDGGGESDDSEESIPNKNFSGMALFDTDSMFFLDLAGGELTFNGTSIYCVDDTKGNNDKDDTGHITWDGAIAMAKWLEKHSGVCKGKNVLELGAGTGFVGMSQIPCGATHVWLTDLEYALPIATANVDKNIEMQSITREAVHVRALDWYDPALEQFTEQELKDIDVVVAADVIWQKVLVVPLAHTIVRLLQRMKTDAAAAYLLYTSRYGKDFDTFVVTSFQENGLVLAVQPHEEMDDIYRYDEAVVWKITLVGGE